jgi:ABC-type dipeptide/oligopeptide/nickel transport system permease component
MGRYIARRLMLSLFVLVGVTVLVSGMLHLSGDPVAVMLAGGPATREDYDQLRRELGYDKSFIAQYFHFLTAAARGDLGDSVRFRQPALPLVAARLPATFQLAAAALLFAVLVAVPVGILSATRPNSLADLAGRLLTLLGQSIPIFWLGIMFVLVFSVNLRLLPAAGKLQPASIILPAITLGLYPMARIARTLRASMLEVLSREYCLTARGKGLSERQVTLRHALPNASLPVVTVIGLQFGVLLGGSVVTETIFAWPGIGWLSVQAIHARDFPVVRAIVAITAVTFTVVNLATDVLLAYLNPRIRYT